MVRPAPEVADTPELEQTRLVVQSMLDELDRAHAEAERRGVALSSIDQRMKARHFSDAARLLVHAARRHGLEVWSNAL